MRRRDSRHAHRVHRDRRAVREHPAGHVHVRADDGHGDRGHCVHSAHRDRGGHRDRAVPHGQGGRHDHHGLVLRGRCRSSRHPAAAVRRYQRRRDLAAGSRGAWPGERWAACSPMAPALRLSARLPRLPRRRGAAPTSGAARAERAQRRGARRRGSPKTRGRDRRRLVRRAGRQARHRALGAYHAHDGADEDVRSF